MLSSCNPPVRQFDLKDQPLSCDEANRASYDALRGMGFRITSFEPAVAGRPGTLKGTSSEGGKNERSATVIIECTAKGANVTASEDGKWLGQLDFKHAYFLSFTAQLALVNAQRERAARLAAGEPDTQKRSDLQVVVEPLSGQAAKLDFDLDLAAGGVLPIRIAIRNPTDRTYRIEADQIRLTRSDRERVEPISPDAAAARVASARVGESGAPVTTLSQQVIADRLRAQLLTAEEVRPGGDVKGFLFFPGGNYTRARVVLTEKESDESEGFVVEFND